MPIYEPGLAEVVADNVKAGRLSFTSDLAASVGDAEAVFIAVGTPSRRGDGHADLTYVFKACEDIAAALKRYTVIITLSTKWSNGAKVEETIRRIRPDADFDVAQS
jgi:UDPglucose 6-dehydrogenase